MTRKLTILMTDQEMLGHEAIHKDDLWYVRTSSDRNMVPLYEFKCDKNLTEFLNDEIFKRPTANEASPQAPLV